MRGVALAGCLALVGPAVLSYADMLAVQPGEDPPVSPNGAPGQHLGVIVPVYRGDLSRAVSSLDRWPSSCSSLTLAHADLVVYYAEGEEDAPAVTAAVETINETAGRCFGKTRLVYAHLREEEDIYPKGPSVMFFKMFLDEGVRSELSEYDALAIVEWDVLVASDRSFEELHYAAFRGNEDFWVKGSNLGGTTFHSTAQESGMWNMLGHINGNAIYNNNDPEFVEYVDYTRTRWDYTYPYDVALWLTISDFPYSWPLWQRYSCNFVTTNLISYVGSEHVDNTTVSDAIAGQTLFIHGSRVDAGNLASLRASKHERMPVYASGPPLADGNKKLLTACNTACGSDDKADLPVGTSTVCDDTCAGESARFGGLFCGAGDPDKFGDMCRLCYVDIEEARREEQSLELTRSDPEGEQEASHVIMCDTMRPPEAAECSDKCGRKKDTVCDESCGTGRHGDYNCNWRDYGENCRFCFDDLETALMADNVAQRRGGRVIMCSTLEPPQPKEQLEPDDLLMKSQSRWRPPRQLQKWNKWRNNYCDEEGCPYTSKDGSRGRICDETCKDGDPYGTHGCRARKGKYGNYCRVCYNDRDKAIENDSATDRAMMCADEGPVLSSAYRTRFLAAPMEENASHIGQMLKAWKDSSTINKDVENNSLDKRKQRKQRKLQDWRGAAKWRAENRWKGNEDHDVLPTRQHSDENDDDTLKWPTEEQLLEKWQANEKWKNYCDEEDCPHTSKDGSRGRVCDDSCKDGNPYGTNGCRARKGKYGNYCRVCYNDRDKAIDNDDPDDRAIMCATVSPVMEYSSSSRRLAASVKKRAPRMLPVVVAEGKDAQSMFADATVLPYVNDLVRGNLCAFVAGHLDEVDQVEVAVMSVLQFLPGMTVAVAADHEGFDAYERAVGGLPGVTVHGTEDPFTASLFADKFCRVDASLIFYMQPGSVVSRRITSKDTHSTHGDLLVVNGNAKLSYVDRELAKQTTAVLGFEAPSFTFNTDLFLPIGANADLRDMLVSGLDIDRQTDGRALEVIEGLMKLRNTSAVPQLMAALAYSRNTPGVWFVDPETWVSQHLFKTASIWEIPLVKPRFTCSIDRSIMLSDTADIDMGLILQSNLDFFANGGTCDTGSLDIRLGD